MAFNQVVRQDDEWFDEPDELDRLARALAAINDIEDPVTAAAVLAYRVARAQAFGEGNKRTAFLLAKWVLDRNGEDGNAILAAGEREFGDLLVRAASGRDVQEAILDHLRRRRR